ncbi:MAG: SHOCT domain-containing protein [Nitrospinae bacterium]|nr:SHOCT domain-containing protein [Nitrospinota bacterium]
MFSGENARLALNRAIENCLKILFENQAFLSALNALDSSPTDISGITPSSPTKKDEGKSNEVKPADRKLEKLKDLYDRNLITKEEYDSERKKILNEL